MHDLDQAIVDDQYAKPAAARKLQAAPRVVTFIKSGQLMETDDYQTVYRHVDDKLANQKRLQQRLAKDAEEAQQQTKEERIAASFAAVADDAPIVHSTKPHLKPTRVWKVLPDAVRAAQMFSELVFDVDPDDKPERRKRNLAPIEPRAKRMKRFDHAAMVMRDDDPRATTGRASDSMIRRLHKVNQAALFLPDAGPEVEQGPEVRTAP